MSSLQKVRLIDDVNNKCYTLFVPPDEYVKLNENSDYAAILLVEYTKAGKVQVSDVEPVNLEEFDATSSNEEQTALSTSNACPQESVIDLTQSAKHDKENASTSDDNSIHNWTDNETYLLIECYRDEGVHYLVHKTDINEAFRRAHVKMNHILTKNNQKKIPYKKCVSKMDQLKRSYKNNIDEKKQSGNQANPWPFFDLMHEMFCKEAWVKPLSTAGNSVQKKLDVATTSTGFKRPNMAGVFFEECSRERKQRKEIDAVKHAEKMSRLDRLTDSVDLIAQSLKTYTAAKMQKMENKD